MNGSHHVYCKDGNEARVVVPVHANKTLKRGLLNAIFKTAGLLSLVITLVN
ncbi:MAG: type II toxin-antitoxin system HicA family toxin [Candidatus Gastranaerophilales bacterium]|nr:type II toxin-antitoxin system HicA family toxin [Candidatus Gastranaerophilales bacterium]